MKINLNSFNNQQSELIIIPVSANHESLMDGHLEESLKQLKLDEKFKGDNGEVFPTFVATENSYKQIIWLGLGDSQDLNGERVRIAISKGLRKAKELKTTRVSMELGHFNNEQVEVILPSMVEAMYLTDYKFSKYKSDNKKEASLDISINGINSNDESKVEDSIIEATTLAEATIIARDLVNEPANVIYPETLAGKAVDLGKTHGFEVEVMDEKQIYDMGMKAFQAVAMGSDKPPRFIIMRYMGNADKADEILGFVGKGLTYDSGGYALKPADSMVTMKNDMGGSAAVIGAISAIAKQGLKINVVAVVAACENMISGRAYKNGDIIGSMAGKTIEILNTDAEGRLTLVDAVHYIIEKEKVTKVVDVATLTGAALVALGTTTTAVISNDDEFYKDLEKAGLQSGEKFWRLPGFDDYKQLIKSDIADLKNSGGRYGGAITAGLFIGEFVGKTPWLHLDIAGTAWTESEKDYRSKGATGAGVRTLYHLAKNKAMA